MTVNKRCGPGQCARSIVFLQYVDDVVTLLRSGVLCKSYADDLKLYSTVQTRQDADDLQSSLDALVAWSDQ